MDKHYFDCTFMPVEGIIFFTCLISASGKIMSTERNRGVQLTEAVQVKQLGVVSKR